MTTLPAEAHENIDQAILQLQSLKSSWAYTPPECLSGLYWQRIFAVVTLLDPEGELIPKPVPEPEALGAGRHCEYHGSLQEHWGPGVAWLNDVTGRYIVETPYDRLVNVRRESLTFIDESSATVQAAVATVQVPLDDSI